MKSLSVTILLAIALLSANAASGCIAYFGYTESDLNTIDAVTTAVSVSMGHIVVQDPADYIVDDVEYIKVKAGPVLIDLANLIFNPNTFSGIDCTHYERGSSSNTLTYYKLRGDYQGRLDTFFSVNGELFQGELKVIGLIIHSEVNNHCVEAWKINTATDYVKKKLSVPGYIQPRLAIGYGLTNTPGGPVSKGFPVKSDGSIAEFPFQPTTIGYWVYDIFNPNNLNHPLNINAESWDSLSNKLNQALRSHQKTFGVLKAFCGPGGASEAAWGIGCPNQAIWKLGVLSNAWRDYWLNDPRNEAIVGFHWPNEVGLFGSNSLPQIWDEHSAIDNARNCTMTFLQLK